MNLTLQLVNCTKLLLFSFLIISSFESNAVSAGKKHLPSQVPGNTEIPKEAGTLPPLLGDDKGGTRIEQIVHWVDLSDQYVLGLGADSASHSLIPYAIYDKKFSTPVYPDFWKMLLLSSLSIGDLNLANLTRLIHDKNAKKESLSNEELELIFENQNLSRDKPIEVAEGFWKQDQILWKPGKKPPTDSKAPNVIFFRDFDWELMLQTNARLKAAVDSYNNANALIRDKNQLPFPQLPASPLEALEELKFVHQSGGYYEIEVPSLMLPIPPVKVIDLRNKASSFGGAIAWGSLTNIVKGGLGAIPFYGPPQFIAANLERTFDLIEALYLDRHAQAMTLVLDALDGNSRSPFLTKYLSPKDLEDAVFYLLRSNSMLSSIFENLVTKDTVLTQKYLAKVNRRRERGNQELLKKGLEVAPLEQSYYSLGYKFGKKPGELEKLRLYTTAYSKFWGKTPPTAVDFLHPRNEQVKRNILQGILYGSNFILLPWAVPGIPSIIRLLYRELVIREFHRRQMWESGLLAHIHHSPHELSNLLVNKVGLSLSLAQEYEQRAVFTLESQRMNPIDLDSNDAENQRHRVERWIQLREQSYKPSLEFQKEMLLQPSFFLD